VKPSITYQQFGEPSLTWLVWFTFQ